MVTPFDAAGAVDLDAAAALAHHLVHEQANDALVISGTAGESPTTTDAEKAALVRAVADAVAGRAQVVAGVGTFDTAHTLHLAEDAAKAGADALLVVTPYYSKPQQSGLLAHFRAVADSSDLPVMLYDIPHRTGVAIAADTMRRLAEHPRIVAVKDAAGDVVASSALIAQTGLAYYCGDDALTLPLLSVGGVGVVGTSTHFSGAATAAMITAYERGDVEAARTAHVRLLPIYRGIFAAPGVVLVKAGLALLGRPVGGLRPPLVEATEAQVAALRADLEAAGLPSGPLPAG